MNQIHKYELMLILKATLPDAQKKTALGKIQELIKEFGGKVEEHSMWGKRYMAYPIKKHQEGYYVIYNISMSAEHAVDLNRLLTINGDVLRHLLRNVEIFEKITTPATDSETHSRKER